MAVNSGEIIEKMSHLNDVSLLDCTLRDGGFGLEDAKKNGVADLRFTSEDIDRTIRCLSDSGIDIIELGSIEISEADKRGFAIYQNIEGISETIPEEQRPGQLFVGLFRGPDTPADLIPDWKPGYCEGLRVIIRYSELQKSLDFCAMLAKKGYKVFVQPMLTMRYSEAELQQVIDAANNMGAYALYFVDSYGYMESEDVIRFLKLYDEKLDEKIHIGFHAHNNIDLAYANAMVFLSQDKKHPVILDACATGMGQGSGNLQTELIVPYLNKKFLKAYDFESVLNVCEMVMKFQSEDIQTWGYSPVRMIAAVHKAAYKYASAMRSRYNMSLVEINRVFMDMPREQKQRYTKEDLDEILKKKYPMGVPQLAD